jgi:hypothetical protein
MTDFCTSPDCLSVTLGIAVLRPNRLVEDPVRVNGVQ